ncbi:hypothetical protein PV10_01542 [Exophiala mesophila]|uniref:Uncharacterized protein n=1 Tax=Exophiala mesophila TaxID=212818 RepID=A0A0D1ZTB9_EXOME|nr:uncharacterized protein PV10_01542 [Exophiala mesophila]KIV97837.1 hypothetical protein PV10_01542 [Exophiala mesophila]
MDAVNLAIQLVTSPAGSPPYHNHTVNDRYSGWTTGGGTTFGIVVLALLCILVLLILATAHGVARLHESGYDHPYVRAVIRPKEHNNYGTVGDMDKPQYIDIESSVDWKVDDDRLAYLAMADWDVV